MGGKKMTNARRFYRNKKNRVIAGVCSGLAGYFNLDPVLVRLLWVLVVLLTGLAPGVIMYLIAWAVVPEK
ncbi:PspC domain-containing protein [Candidatus Woesearchaeota archaeon]|nr:PspC domain-containing protein [Candidatus Woesearchaeota archaeon]